MYGSPDESTRSLLWQKLNRVGDSTSYTWLLTGDFNSIKSPIETTNVSKYTMQMYCQFASWINEVYIVDLGFTGTPFT